MKKQLMILITAALLAISSTGFAMDHSSMSGMDHGKKMDDKTMDHGSMPEMNHDSMAMGGKMIMLGTEEVDGVKGMFHLNDVREQMAAHGMSQTHHLMGAFEGADGKAIETGTVAVKVTDPAEQTGDAVQLMGMDGHFGVDLTLDKKGSYTFMIATKLADGAKRIYHMQYENN